MDTLTTPAVLQMPFANSGDKNTIPVNATGSQLASLQEGFPVITQTAISQGGVPPERNDFNGILNLATQFYYSFQNGWHPTFSDSVSTAIGGYPLNAILWYGTGNFYVKSLVSNNTYNFNVTPGYIGTYWKKITSSAADLEQYYPIGGLAPFAGSTAPENYLVCDGSAVSREDYSELFAVIGTTYGEGDGSTTFNLPDFVGRTIWGGSTSGTVLAAGLPNISGTATNSFYRNTPTFSGPFSYTYTGGELIGEDRHDAQFGNLTFDASAANSIYGNSTTVQPPALQIIVCIKYQ